MSQQVVRDFRENESLRHGFDALAQQVFGISFEAWYRQGYWTDRYRPYLLVQDDLPVACAAANLQDLWWDGRVRRCIQIGTVMTAPAARDKIEENFCPSGQSGEGKLWKNMSRFRSPSPRCG